MRQTKAVANEAQGSSTQQYNQAQEAHLICHVHTEGRAARGCSPPALSDTDIPQQEPAAVKKIKKKGSQWAQLVLSSRAKVSRDGCHMAEPPAMPTGWEVSGSSRQLKGARGPGTASAAPLAWRTKRWLCLGNSGPSHFLRTTAFNKGPRECQKM